MLMVFNVILETPQNKWYQKNGFWIFNTEYGYIIMGWRMPLTSIRDKIEVEWPERFDPIDFNNELRIMAAIDCLAEADLRLGIMYEETGKYRD